VTAVPITVIVASLLGSGQVTFVTEGRYRQLLWD